MLGYNFVACCKYTQNADESSLLAPEFFSLWFCSCLALRSRMDVSVVLLYARVKLTPYVLPGTDFMLF